MAGLYSNVGRKPKNHSFAVAIVLAAVVFVLLAFIIWCAVSFSGDGYKNTAQEVSDMKILLNEREAEISVLKEQIVKLEEKNKQLESQLTSLQKPIMPTSAPTPTPSTEPEED